MVVARRHPTRPTTSPTSPTFENGALTFIDRGTLPGGQAHDYTALVASDRAPDAGETGPSFRGPQPGAVCKDGDKSRRRLCDDGPFGKGAGGQLRYRVTRRPARAAQTVWIAVAGSTAACRRRTSWRGAQDPDAQLRPRSPRATRSPRARRSTCPATARCRRRVDWGKQNLADLTQTATNLQIRFVDQGKAYPRAGRTTSSARRSSAPATPTTRGCSPPTASTRRSRRSRSASSSAIKAHLTRAARGLRHAQRPLRQGRARDRHRRLGLLRRQRRPGQHRRVGQVPERRRARLALDGRRPLPRPTSTTSRDARDAGTSPTSSTPTRTAGPRASATSSAPGMGEEKLDNAVYLIRGLYDLADMARAKARPRHAALGARALADRLRAALRRDVVERRLDPVRRLARRRQRPGPAAALDRRHADGGGADDRARPVLGLAPTEHAAPRARRARDGLLQRHRAVQPRPLPHRLRGRPGGQGRADRLLAQHRDQGRRRRQLRPRASSAATRTPTRSTMLPTSSPARCRRSSPRPDQNREHRPLLDVPLDVHAGLGPLRHRLAGDPPAARRAAGARYGRLEVVPAIPAGQTRIARQRDPPRRRPARSPSAPARRPPSTRRRSSLRGSRCARPARRRRAAAGHRGRARSRSTAGACARRASARPTAASRCSCPRARARAAATS